MKPYLHLVLGVLGTLPPVDSVATEIYSVENRGYLTEHSVDMELDRFTRPHITYWIRGENPLTEGTVRYATRVLGNWSFEVIDSVGTFPSHAANEMVLDEFGQPHVLYFDYSPEPDEVKYATRSVSGWTIETIDLVTGSYGDIAVDSLGAPQVCYNSLGTGLVWASRSGGAWVLETVDSVNFDAFNGLEIDTLGVPHVAFAKGNDLVYSQRSLGTWTSETIQSTGPHPHLSLVLDGTNPHLAYVSAGAVLYATKSAGNWSMEVVQVGGTEPGGALSLRLGANGRHRIAFGPIPIKLATRLGPLQWDVTSVISEGSDDLELGLDVGHAETRRLVLVR